ncbi:hypothetical protein BCV69DRAFT_88141 [Microstroma glucosiphilum]|uniref:Uncharacterized protein n=1 Tax=Pseudomicrostroma glucosiphilum TaxID=1684307 RepID=A0A316TWP6_9BASI|nr:hypothetical protein BCV69DRAFT_88141 [Pseudomicrostroma glucosiphilum]PWN17906.1 hypothetical protein BCV69DRAFT_88141 [Pseudomicrostroma glucosiphilum]
MLRPAVRLELHLAPPAPPPNVHRRLLLLAIVVYHLYLPCHLLIGILATPLVPARRSASCTVATRPGSAPRTVAHGPPQRTQAVRPPTHPHSLPPVCPRLHRPSPRLRSPQRRSLVVSSSSLASTTSTSIGSDHRQSKAPSKSPSSSSAYPHTTLRRDPLPVNSIPVTLVVPIASHLWSSRLSRHSSSTSSLPQYRTSLSLGETPSSSTQRPATPDLPLR